MLRKVIAPNDLLLRPCGVWDLRWALLASGDFLGSHFNCMTVSWGGLGVMWGKPFVMVVVRPQRHTRGFMDAADSFTLSVLPREYRQVLEVLGTKSGREMDKIHHSGLTPVASKVVASPSFEEAELVLECRKMYFADFDPAHFLAEFIPPLYKEDYHRMYFGQIQAALGTADYQAPGV